MTIRSICIHGHFYQPPREDPVTGLVPREPGATPYKNWNERIHAECYRPNAELGNFGRMSFNVGPTLFHWMESHDQNISRKIVEQDKENVKQYGVGNAMAQAFNHTILPLASYQDKVTQVTWGIADFQKHYGRRPQGMWLPETAADVETLCVLAERGIEFTILAPWQAKQAELDTTEPYRVTLPGGNHITVFFYNRALSTQISFDPQSTINADVFTINEVLPQYSLEKTKHHEPQIVMIATDGELYGHHQPFRDRFLARMVDGAASHNGITPTYPALWLKNYPPRKSAEINDNTSWSCYHGVTRWMGACSCTPGDGSWKHYLRHAMDRLSIRLDQIFAQEVSRYIADPWELRNRYIYVILGEISARDLVNEMAGRSLPQETFRCIHQLLEAQRERQRMYTSCGWFFDDFDRIEPKNNVAYAAQAVHLTYLATGVDLSPQVMQDFKRVKSQHHGTRGDAVFNRQLRRVHR
ncbi:MAG: DUF3536 domain-containing protein [Omnitrophica WOR_2 bacterium]